MIKKFVRTKQKIKFKNKLNFKSNLHRRFKIFWNEKDSEVVSIMVRSIKSLTIKSLKKTADIYLLKVYNRNTRTRCGICSQLTIKIPARHQWSRSDIFIVNFENI